MKSSILDLPYFAHNPRLKFLTILKSYFLPVSGKLQPPLSLYVLVFHSFVIYLLKPSALQNGLRSGGRNRQEKLW
jgi:hypothetical protein